MLIFIEKMIKLTKILLKITIKLTCDKLKQNNNRCPKAIDIHWVDKKIIGVRVPDFFLGVFGHFMNTPYTVEQRRRPYGHFEMLRDKIRVIYNVNKEKNLPDMINLMREWI